MLTIAALMLSSGLAPRPESPDATPRTTLTIYSSADPGSIDPDLYRPIPGQPPGYRYSGGIPGYAVVREDRSMDIAKGVSQITYPDVAALIDPTSVQFRCPTDPATTVLEQNYQFDLVSPDKLLERFIDQDIRVVVQRGDKTQYVDGTLLSNNFGQLVMRTSAGVELINGYLGVSLGSLPKGLLTRPTLLWKVNAPAAGARDVRVSYQTDGLTWWADYNLVFHDGADANTGTLDASAWVSIINQSGATFDDATLKLVAGDVHRAPRNRGGSPFRDNLGAAAKDEDSTLGFQEKSFFEYHLYTLGRSASLPNNSTKQLELFTPVTGIPCTKVIMYDGMGSVWWDDDSLNTDQGPGPQTKKDVDVFLKFSNSHAAGLGMPWPAGRVRVSKLDAADGALEFIGEDVIRHTPRDEDILVRMGKAFDVVGERRQTNFQLDTDHHTMQETYEIKVRNHKDAEVRVLVQEHLWRWAQWQITAESSPHEKASARLVHFPVTIKPNAEVVVTYTVRYTW